MTSKEPATYTQRHSSLNRPMCSLHRMADNMLVVSGVRSITVAATDTGALVTDRCSVKVRKQDRRPVSRSRHLLPGAPKGLHLVTRRRGRETISWRMDLYMRTTQGGMLGDNTWT